MTNLTALFSWIKTNNFEEYQNKQTNQTRNHVTPNQGVHALLRNREICEIVSLCSIWLCPYVMTCVGRRRRCSSQSETAVRISRERFDLESPNFTFTSIPVGLQPHWIWRHWLLPVGSYQSSKYCRKYCFRQLPVEFLENTVCQGYQILHAYWGRSPSQTCQIWHHWLLTVGCKTHLNTTQKCVKWVWPG